MNRKNFPSKKQSDGYGYDDDGDHRAITRSALGRRVTVAEPAHSLLLIKPTAAVPHKGGERFKTDSPEYQILADWIASGAPGPQANDLRIEDGVANLARSDISRQHRVASLQRAALAQADAGTDVRAHLKRGPYVTAAMRLRTALSKMFATEAANPGGAR